MHIKLLKDLPIARHNHLAGETVDVDKNRAKSLINAKAAIKAAPPADALPADGDDEPVDDEDGEDQLPIRREASLPPRGRRATRNP